MNLDCFFFLLQMCPIIVKNNNKKKSRGGLMSVHDAACYTGLFLIRPALFLNGTDGQSEWTKDDRRKQAIVLKDFGLDFFFFLFGCSLEIYTACFPLGHTHLDYRHYVVCVLCAPEHANGSAC